MRKSALKISLFALAISCTALSCKKDSTSATATSSEVAFDVSSDNPGTVVAAVNSPVVQSFGTAAIANNLVWTAGVANISTFKLEAKKNGVQAEIITKNLTVDLFALTPATIAAKIDTGTYKEIEIKAVLQQSAGNDIPLKLNGTFTTPGGAIVPVEFDYNDAAVIKVEAENVTVDGTNNVSAHLGLHLNRLLSSISAAELVNATRTGGAIVVSSTSNTAIYNKVRLNILLAFISKGWEKRRK